MVSVGTATTVGVVTSARENRADMALKIPVVAELGQRVAVSRRIGGKWGGIGFSAIQRDSPPARGRGGLQVDRLPRVSGARPNPTTFPPPQCPPGNARHN